MSQSVYKVVCPIRELIASVYATGWNSRGFLMYTYGHVWLWFSSSLGSLDYDRVEKSQGFGLG